jgi:hypothetical protein
MNRPADRATRRMLGLPTVPEPPPPVPPAGRPAMPDIYTSPVTERAAKAAGISPLQFDLATAIVRIEQIAEVGPDSVLGAHLLERVFTCDVPRLRGHLEPEALAMIDEEAGRG